MRGLVRFSSPVAVSRRQMFHVKHLPLWSSRTVNPARQSTQRRAGDSVRRVWRLHGPRRAGTAPCVCREPASSRPSSRRAGRCQDYQQGREVCASISSSANTRRKQVGRSVAAGLGVCALRSLTNCA